MSYLDRIGNVGFHFEPTDGEYTWNILQYSADLSTTIIDSEVERALSLREAELYGLKMTRTDSEEADIKIIFANSGDEIMAGEGDFQDNEIAYAYRPGGARSGQVYLNDAYNWAIVDSSTTASVFEVVVHEVGHTFNLLHTDDPNDIMYPYDVELDQDFTKETRQALLHLYQQYIPEIKKEKGALLETYEYIFTLLRPVHRRFILNYFKIRYKPGETSQQLEERLRSYLEVTQL